VIAVVGPTRMAYWRAVSMVRFMASVMDVLTDEPAERVS
jgi:transcriptional regulator of heat shock response